MDSNMNVDIVALCQYIYQSLTFPTKSIMDLQSEVFDWLLMNTCGSIIYGESRVGKTCAIKYISQSLKITYGNELPIYTLNYTLQVPTQKTFYESVLMTIAHENPSKGTAVQQRQRIINRIIVNALDTKYRRAVLFIDEAQLLSEKIYLWLIDLYNELSLNNILLTVFLFGTPELKQYKTHFIKSGKKQIVHRFMVNEFEFKGITCIKDAVICLVSMDKPFSLPGTKEPIILSKLFFPEYFYSTNDTLAVFANNIWTAFKNVNNRFNLYSDQILMKYFIDTVILCLRKYGSYGKKSFFPTLKDWEHCVEKSGYILSQTTR